MPDLIDTIADWFYTGGWPVMLSIFLTLIVSIVVTVERVIRYWTLYDLTNAQDFMTKIQKYVMNNSIENAIRLCKKYQPALLPFVVAEGLKKANHSTNEIEYALDHANLKASPLR